MTTDWLDCGRSSVQTWDCDQMGHMNVQFYVQRSEEAVSHLALALGLGPSIAREANARLTPSQHHMRFHRELRPGAPYWLRAAPVFVDDNAIAITVELLATATGQTAFALTGLYQWRDRVTHAVLDMPEIAKAAARRLLRKMPDTALERGVKLTPPRAQPTHAEVEALNLVVAYRGEVTDQACDPSGLMRVRDYMGRVSDGIPNLLAQTMGFDRASDGDGAGVRIGGAALEYRFVYRQPARLGDLISVRSGVTALAAKTYNWVHWIVNDETGVVHATAEAVAVVMDLDARKAIEIPPAMRELLQPLLKPGLTP